MDFPSTSRTTAKTEPTNPCSNPSSMNGPRTNQLVAPTSFITSISRRRAKIDSRMVFAISSVDAVTSRTMAGEEVDVDEQMELEVVKVRQDSDAESEEEAEQEH